MKTEGRLLYRAEVVKAVIGSHFECRLLDAPVNSDDSKVLGYISGSLKKFKIHIVCGDTVLLELSPYDLKRGRIVYRL